MAHGVVQLELEYEPRHERLLDLSQATTKARYVLEEAGYSWFGQKVQSLCHLRELQRQHDTYGISSAALDSGDLDTRAVRCMYLAIRFDYNPCIVRSSRPTLCGRLAGINVGSHDHYFSSSKSPLSECAHFYIIVGFYKLTLPL